MLVVSRRAKAKWPIPDGAMSNRRSVSLRGSLAQEACDLSSAGEEAEAAALIARIVQARDNGEFAYHFKGKTIVIGLAKERGQFKPDW